MPLLKIKILISGGGTGGHIFPAIAIANALKEKLDDPEILFVGAKGRMEMTRVPEAGYPIEGIWISGLQRKLTLRNLLFPLKLISSLISVGRIIRRFKPDIAIGVGGYASGPALRVAAGKGIKTLIQEQNSYPGITNKLLAARASRICVAYEGMEKYFPGEKIVITGNPVRANVIDIKGKKEEAIRYFDLDQTKKTLLIVGGSQGALSINKSISGFLKDFEEQGLQLIWQTGPGYFTVAKELITASGLKNIKPHSFITKMDLAYATADMVVSRAGAIAIAELCAVGKPAIFIPLPSAAEDHQTKNALALVEKKAAILINDREAPLQLGNAVSELLKDETQCRSLSTNIRKLAHRDASSKIAEEVIKLIKNVNG